MGYPRQFASLVTELSRLPGISRRSAERLALFILNMPEKSAKSLVQAIASAREKVRRCEQCFNISSGELCGICSDDARDCATLCVVETPRDIASVERSHEYNGLYHVLLGKISPLAGVGPEDLTIKSLLERLKRGKVKEVIMATGTDVEGEATACYVARVVAELGVAVSRIACGVPMGGPLEFVDEMTLGKAVQGRRRIESDGGPDTK
ncbi:MAG: recombination protein RecR [Candidatus Coatesbacteria bacterium]|nr:recombination protein RecR [Candidatus Coatesbacteria bacterium]